MILRRAWLVLAALPLFVCCGGSAPCDGASGTCKSFTTANSESEISTAFATAADGTTIAFDAGTFKFKNGLGFTAKNITVKGMGQGSTILDFSGQTAGTEGILGNDGANGAKFVDFTIQDTPGNGIKVINATNVVFRRVTTQWTSAVNSSHGAYGLYPVLCTNVLIDSSTVIGAADAGIYVGQSDTIVVQNSTAMKSVAGIEIENSTNADVHDNTATLNAGGILIFDLPGIKQPASHVNAVRVYNNQVLSNNGANFGAAGSTVSLVPSGVGMLVMANAKVEVSGNTITDNKSAAFATVSFLVTQVPYTDASYYPFPTQVYVHNNTISNNGTRPDGNSQLGLLLNLVAATAGGAVPALLYDGILDPSVSNSAMPDNTMAICFNGNTGTDIAGKYFANLHMDQLTPTASNLGTVMKTDPTAYTCTLAALPAVTLPSGL